MATWYDALYQLLIDFFEGLLAPTTIVAYISGISLVIFLIYYWWYRPRKYRKDLTPYRYGDYLISLPHIAERDKVTLFGMDIKMSESTMDLFADVLSRQPQLKSLSTSQSKGQPAKGTDADSNKSRAEKRNIVKEIFGSSKFNAHFYAARHMYTEGTKKGSGYSLIMTNLKLEESQAYTTLSQTRGGLISAEPTRLREVHQSLPNGIVFRFGKDHDRRWHGLPVDLVFYPAEPIVKGTTATAIELEAAEGLLSFVSMLDVVVPTLKLAKYNKDLAVESQRGLKKALSKLLLMAIRLQGVSIASSTEAYEPVGRQMVQQGFSWIVTAAMMAAGALIGPPVFRQLDPTFTDQAYVLFGLFSAFLIAATTAWWIGKRKKTF